MLYFYQNLLKTPIILLEIKYAFNFYLKCIPNIELNFISLSNMFPIKRLNFINDLE